MRTSWLLLAVLALAGCRDHALEDGAYALTPGAVLRDDCALAGTLAVGPGRLRTVGHQVSLALEQPDLRLTGSYRYGVESFFLDGSLVQTSATLGGRECALDTVSVHVDGSTVDPAAFTGTMAMHFDSARADACVCRYWFEFSAARQGP